MLTGWISFFYYALHHVSYPFAVDVQVLKFGYIVYLSVNLFIFNKSFKKGNNSIFIKQLIYISILIIVLFLIFTFYIFIIG